MKIEKNHVTVNYSEFADFKFGFQNHSLQKRYALIFIVILISFRIDKFKGFIFQYI
jgi:hypothetical protein